MNTQTKSFGQKLWTLIKDNPIVVMLVIACIPMCFVDNFATLDNLNDLATNTTIRFLIALGVSGCLITKGTDLSAGRQAALSATLTAVMVQAADYSGKLFKWMPEMNMWAVLLIVVAIGAVIGLCNGLIIAYLKVPPFIATLGIQTIVYGINLIYTNSQPIGGFSNGFNNFFRFKVLSETFANFRGFNFYIVFALFAGLIFWFIYNKTTHGKYMYAIGGNESAAEVSGVNVRGRLTAIYTTAGIMYAIAGWLMCGKSGGASASMGVSYELEAIAGCTIGGVSTTGGIGTVGGILVGVLVFELLKIILIFLGVNPNYNYIAQGLVVITAVALDIRKYVAKK
ncbi:MAG: beta-methylgalactoside transporter [Oscillospiraceae bacterium]|nr:beta-methylgalactoside transporter [Oscillospiraceae bacterium]